MNEAYLKRRLRDAVVLRHPGVVVLRHEDKFAGGVPDMSLTRGQRTCWVEVKFARGGNKASPTALQAAALRRLGGLLVTYRMSTSGEKTTCVSDYADVSRGPMMLDGHPHAAVADAACSRLDDAYDMVRAFNVRFGYVPSPRPAFQPDEAGARLFHMREEVHEYAAAMASADMVGVADALVDIVYVAVGAAVNMGLPWRALFREVHAANMRKALSGDGGYKGGVVKPHGWCPPDIAGVLRRAGWEG